MKRENTWKNRHSGQFDEQKFMDYAAVRDSLYVKSNTATQFVTGMLSAMPGAKLAQEKASAIASERSVWSDDIADIGAQNYMENAARNGAAAYSWGNITGNVAYLLALSELTGGLVEPLAAGTGGSAAVSSANILRSGLTFGIAEGTREAGEQDWSDAWNALKETGKAAKKGAIKGMVGALAAELTAPGIVNTVEKYRLAPQYLQYAQRAISNAAYSAGVVGTNYLLTPAGKKPSFKELGTQLAVSFLFSVAMAGVDTLLNGTETGAYKAPDGNVTDAGEELTELRDELLTMNGRLSDPEGAAHVLEITGEMRGVIKEQGVAYGSAGITLDLLDRIDDYVMGVQPEAPSYMYQYPETDTALTQSAGGALIPTVGNLPAVAGDIATGNSYIPGIAAAGAAEAVQNFRPDSVNVFTPKEENPYTTLLSDLFMQDRRVPEPVMQNFLAVNPNKTKEDIQAYYEKYLRDTGQVPDLLLNGDLIRSTAFEGQREEKPNEQITEDYEQYEEFKELLGSDAPKNYDDFLQIKYYNQSEWDALQIEARMEQVIRSTPCTLTERKYSGYFLKPGAKHADDFFSVGYTEADIRLLRYDMARQFDMDRAVEFKELGNGRIQFNIYITLGVNKKKPSAPDGSLTRRMERRGS